MTPFQFLMNCCQQYWQLEPISQRTDQYRAIDWPVVIATAQTQGILPLVYQYLHQHAWSALPPTAQTQLTQAVHQQLQQTFRVVATLRQLLPIFEAAQIPVLPFKGPILAQSLYGNVALRRMRDLDLLVYPQDVLRVHELLWQQGYQCCDRLSAAQLQQRIRANSENALVHSETGSQIDLHWGMVPRYYACQLPPEELFAQAQDSEFQGWRCLSLPPSLQMLMLCLNGLKEGWFELQRLCDLAAGLRRYPDLDWSAVLALARRKDGDRALLLGLALTQRILRVALPSTIEQAIARDRTLAAWRERLTNRLLAQDYRDWNLWTQTLLPLRLQRRPTSQLYSLSQLVLPINERDLSLGVLPRSLFWLYYPWRLVRLLDKYLRLLWWWWWPSRRKN
ncbi:MAG: nucleotidyltransferase family protein [Spirulina sp. SIO3F2]|nr:nucleotidyltransferase family protein [Spirulina sp. SIO3F2]